MSTPQPFALTSEQQSRLLACRAAWEEGEGEERLERLRQVEEDAETLRAIRQLWEETHFVAGNDLTPAQMSRLLALVRALSPNPNLDARLLRQPDEPANLNRDLRELLFGSATVPVRIAHFLTRRHAGGQTALQFLCAAFPTEWPLITRAAFNALEITPEQRAGLRQEEEGAENRTVRNLLAEVALYRAVRAFLQAPDFVTVHRLLAQGLAAKRFHRRSVAPLVYTPLPPSETPPPYPATAETTAPALLCEAPSEYIASPSAVVPDLQNYAVADLLLWLEGHIAAQGFTYPPLTLRNYYIALQTKPFVLLSGLSGTGKTRLTHLLAEALTADPAQYRLLPVRPDWADSTPLLGYVNLLARGGEGRFVSTPFLDFLLQAARPENGHRAYFLCLDEMNLARVEHYFAEILSAMETPNRELLLPDGRALRLPANLFLTGTLNLDEATHSLSRKVLDRANTLTFHEVCLREEAPETAPLPEPMDRAIRQALFLHERVTTVAAARTKLRQVGSSGEDYAARTIHILTEANHLLESQGLHFAYRVRDEVLRYCANSFDREGRGLLSPNAPDDTEGNLLTALDFQLLQKVLPRLTGTREQLESAVRGLLGWAERSRLPRTALRLARLLARLERDGFAGFEEG